jgi:hypothetical protein
MNKKSKFITLVIGCLLFSGALNAAPIKSNDDIGKQTAASLQSRYITTVTDCGSASTPAFLCSGIVFRGTSPSNTYHSWNPSPESQQSGGVSFSYLRKDSKYSALAYNYSNGFIFYQIFGTPSDKIDIEILCSFPIDAATLSRKDAGCGAHNEYPDDSGPCQQQGIYTAEQWYTHYTQPGISNPRTYQCGFDVSDDLGAGSADAFYQSILAMSLIPTESIKTQNELRLATWAQDIPTTLPIQAFFYISNGLANAQYDQQDFYNQSGIFIPIIALHLPASLSDDATFIYNPGDQVIK